MLREPYVEEARLWALMAACDAVVQLRAPTMGETSGSAIRTLGLGKPLVVSDVGWFAELPGDVALKVPVGGDEETAALVRAFERLAEPGVAGRMGEAAQAYVRAEHDLDRVAGRYVSALEQTAGAPAVEAKIGRAVAAAAAETGVEAEAVAPELAELGLLGPSGHAPAPGACRGRLRSLPMWAWLSSLYIVAVVVQLTLALRLVSPWIMADELIYSDMARSFADTGRFALRGASANYGFVYPLLISPAYALFGSVQDAYDMARVLNVLAICSVVLPVYLLARRVVRPGAALAAAAFSVAIPPMIYSGTLMTENAFYPIFAWLAYALVLALESPTLRRQLILLAALRPRIRHARAGGRARRRSARRAASARVDRTRPASAARRVEAALRDRRGRRARSSSSSRSRAASRRRGSSAATASRRRTRPIPSGAPCAGSPITSRRSILRSGSFRSRR